MLTLRQTLFDSAVTHAADSAQPAKPLLHQTFGPWLHCQALVWEQLVDFASWTAWMPGVRAVNRLDGGAPGRGSRLQIDKPFHSEFWEVTHWHCQNRFDFEIANPHCRAGFSVSLAQSIDEDHVNLRLDCEFIPGNNGRLLAWLTQRRLQANSVLWLRAFTDYFLAQKPPVD